MAAQEPTLALDDWTGSWELERRENWVPHLQLMGVAPADYEAVLSAQDLHCYRVDAGAYTMEQRFPAQQLHLLFRADLDGELHDAPCPMPAIGPWPCGAGHYAPRWRNFWVEEPVCFRTEMPGIAGHAERTLSVERRLVSRTQIRLTLQVLGGDASGAGAGGGAAAALGPCWAELRKRCGQGPAPIAWLRARGQALATAEQRRAALQRAARLVAENVELFTAAQAQDRLCPARFDGVANLLLGGCALYGELVPQWMAAEEIEDLCPAQLRAGVEAEWAVVNEPKGICINVAPWNAPVQLSMIPVLAMLAAGNLCVVKPPELVPNVSRLIRRLCHTYLAGYVWVEEGGAAAVERLIDEGADHLVFTGGAEIAKIVAARCARMLTPVTLELGGKNPVFIDKALRDSMLDDVVREILETKVAKAGQFCCAHDYALVHEEIHGAFCTKFSAAVEALGDERNVAIVGRRQYEALKGKLADAAVEGIPACGGRYVPNDTDMTVPMTGLLEPSLEKAVFTAEIFGPLLPIVKVRDVDEAIAKIRRMVTGKPLIAYCYSEDPEAVEAFVARTFSGNVAVNGGPQRMISNYACAFGGVGPSGCGTSMWGREAMREFSHRRHVMRARGGFARSFFSAAPPPAAATPHAG